MKYWKDIEELKEKEIDGEESKNGGSHKEERLLSSSSRRDFLKYFGFGIASTALLASCAKPVKKAIPLLIKPEEITPGIANNYASTFYDGNEIVPIVVKVRDGRPIKIEGNQLSANTKGGTSARVQASLLNLYDESRPQEPQYKGEPISWEKANSEIVNKLKNVNKTILLLTPSTPSLSTERAIGQFLTSYPKSKRVIYDSISYSALREAHKSCFGTAILPNYQFDKAEVIVSFNADFLGTWLQPIRFTTDYTKNRKLINGERTMSRHIQFESTMTLTGSNADDRFVMNPQEEGKYVLALYQALTSKRGIFNSSEKINTQMELVAEELIKHLGKTLVVSGSSSVDVQNVVVAINELLTNYGKTILVDGDIQNYAGSDIELEAAIKEIETGTVGALICYDTDPYYSLPINEAKLDTIGLKIVLSARQTESTAKADYLLPIHHYLEQWGDAVISSTELSLSQPVINPIFNTRQPQEILLDWSGNKIDYYDFVRETWKNEVFKDPLISFEKYWKLTLRDGILTHEPKSAIAISPLNKLAISASVNKINSQTIKEGITLHLYQNIAIGDGYYANNPWLQELPDPVSKTCWDNYFAVSPGYATLRGFTTGDVVKIGAFTLPILVQPGQTRNVVSMALGYGHKNGGTVATGIGENGFKMVSLKNSERQYYQESVEITATGSTYELATTQSHSSMEGRELIRETTLDEYLENPSAGNEAHEEFKKIDVSLYQKHEYNGHKWGMVIDQNSCTGCNACVVACSVENNVPVVGRNEVRRSHEMHWIRIDRYYNGDPENPSVVRQPVMCQHCDNAPCENVCPVSATNHSSEGLNQMAYNRCIGTRYCNNNCPYKVRRFNWFDYTGGDAIPFNTVDPASMTLDIKRMVLNPDVVIRAKGVIEKCSLCVQRIQEKKMVAKREGRALADEEVRTACQQACPAQAIVFGDVNNPESKISKALTDPRRYNILEELHVLPAVGYLTKIRNRKNQTI
ncbi:MAG: 4Fe-4S dicluster domain-containing protein [Breznakibacter sp.]|nr:4Fe-4S dicluster domain-containing protein [Breznakibacter sp.]